MSDLDRSLSLLGGLGFLLSAFRQKRGGKFKLLLGAEMVRRGMTGHCYTYQALGFRSNEVKGASVSVPYELGVRARVVTTIAKPRDVVFRFWRDFENLPRIMKHLKSVSVKSPKESHWIAEGPTGRALEWDSEVHNEIENELIA